MVRFSIAPVISFIAAMMIGATSPLQAEGTPQVAEPQAQMAAHRLDLHFDGLDDLTIYIARPAELDPDGHRALVYFVGGGQEEEHVRGMLGSHIVQEAVRRGYIVLLPVAPCWNCTFVASGADYFPALFDKLREIIPMSQDRFHLMGFSNGGRSSLHLGTRHPEYVASITTYPGYLRNRKYELLENLADVCVVMYVGGKDESFLTRHRIAVARLRKLGHPVFAKVYLSEGHNIDPLWRAPGAKLLMDGIDNRLGCRESSE